MFDTKLLLKDTGAVTTSGYGTVDASAQVVNLGSGLVRGNLIIDISSIDIQTGDELYELHLIGGNDESFSREVSLCSKELGHNSQLQGNLDSKISRAIMPFQNEERGVIYPYVRVRHVLSGATPSINYTARLEKDLPLDGEDYSFTTTTTV